MNQFISAISLVVPDYDQALDFYVGKLGFDKVEDTILSPTKRWVRVVPPGGQTCLLLAKTDGEVQAHFVGNQTGGRVFLFLNTDDFERDYNKFKKIVFGFLKSHDTKPMAALWCLKIRSAINGI